MSYQAGAEGDSFGINQAEVALDGEEYQDQVELQEENQEIQEGNSSSDIPTQKKPESLYTLFQRVWKTQDSSKVANLNSWELGRLNISVRDSQYIALLGAMLHHEKFASFFKSHAELTLSTSASKKGWFTELFVSQKKYTARSLASNQASNPQTKSKWKIFGGQNSQAESENS